MNRLGVIGIGLSTLLVASTAAAAEARLDRQALERTLTGNTISFPSSDLEPVTAYMAPGGALRGRFEGEDFTGRWTVEGDRLCLDLPGDIDDGCRTVIGRDGAGLQLFTPAGEPAGELGVETGNPRDF